MSWLSLGWILVETLKCPCTKNPSVLSTRFSYLLIILVNRVGYTVHWHYRIIGSAGKKVEQTRIYFHPFHTEYLLFFSPQEVHCKNKKEYREEQKRWLGMWNIFCMKRLNRYSWTLHFIFLRLQKEDLLSCISSTKISRSSHPLSVFTFCMCYQG